MNGFQHRWVLACLIIFKFVLVLGGINRLKCYNCRSPLNGKCGDPFNVTMFKSTDCIESDYVCMKQVQVLDSTGKNLEILRGCVAPKYCKLYPSKYCSQCGTQACNSSSSPNHIFATISGISLLFVQLLKG